MCKPENDSEHSCTVLLHFENAVPKTRPNNSKHSSDTHTGKRTDVCVCVSVHFPPQCCTTVAKYSANLLSVTAQWVEHVHVSLNLKICIDSRKFKAATLFEKKSHGKRS